MCLYCILYMCNQHFRETFHGFCSFEPFAEGFQVYTHDSLLFCLHDQAKHKTSSYIKWRFFIVTMKAFPPEVHVHVHTHTGLRNILQYSLNISRAETFEFLIFEVMHLDISIITFNIILPHASIGM